jgi:hypothetical protein
MSSPESPFSDLDEQVRRLQRRTVRYWFEDGLVELFLGVSLLVIALYVAAMELSPGGVGGILGGLFPALFIMIFVAGQRLVRRAKERLVYPRTGFVSYPRASPRRRTLAPVVAAIVAALLVVLVRRAPPLATWIPAINGLFMAGLLLLVNRTAALVRLSFLAAVAAVAGLLLALSGAPTGTAVGTLFAVLGLTMAAGGGLALRHYLRHAPPPEGA